MTAISIGPAVFYRIALEIFGPPSFSSTILLSSSVATICVHAIFEIADDVGEIRDLADDIGVGFC